MDKGPDALIDSLLTDIAFSGTRGESKFFYLTHIHTVVGVDKCLMPALLGLST